ncbi:maf-like protein [Capsaspora owczarzaki ATCC 30864]|uniref:Maf-like protein n=1 Tax=Capsaspora owczarzaki (strain ATCC 30864) TaxID=595528 RepID=A0A0D2WVE9_CAPO3|nr:maf-like protein [Capsaspora owczarzaki ATCC 30864]KJE96128.1 maf-like protein [Capsaspora owczarzaki ATCC 30864]|eukprot:XP_004345244.2 maf-like protein [Capsaspora owczarzaki ATCC 30864]
MAELPIVLGSSSKWRQRVFREHGYTFTTMTADIDEKAVNAGAGDRSKADPRALTLAVAGAKAAAILPKLTTPCLLITSDQVVAYQGTIREKPETAEECRRFLKCYETTPAVTCAAIVVTNTLTGQVYQDVSFASQLFHPIPDDVITRTIERGDIMSCCGGFMIDDVELKQYLSVREGTEDSIMGLPMDLVQRLLDEARRG